MSHLTVCVSVASPPPPMLKVVGGDFHSADWTRGTSSCEFVCIIAAGREWQLVYTVESTISEAGFVHMEAVG